MADAEGAAEGGAEEEAAAAGGPQGWALEPHVHQEFIVVELERTALRRVVQRVHTADPTAARGRAIRVAQLPVGSAVVARRGVEAVGAEQAERRRARTKW